LRRSGADNVVMLIDACRSDGAKNAGMGIGEEKQQGVITFFSCSPSQVSYEIDEIGQGAFTNVLLEALRIQGEGNCATVERFANYLKARVPQLTKRYKNYVQSPYVKIEPETKLHYILLPKFANLTDITLLKSDAAIAEAEESFDLAFQLWMRVNVASGGTDLQAINAFERLANKRSSASPQPKATVSVEDSKQQTAPSAYPPSVSTKFKREYIDKKTLPPVVEVKRNSVGLFSAKGIDYRGLEKLLKDKEWFKADELTRNLMLEVAIRRDREWLGLAIDLASKVLDIGTQKWLEKTSIQNFPCEDLMTIDQLWVYYSGGKYGFSVQKKLWIKCGGKIGQYDWEAFKKFAAEIGWYNPQKNNWNDIENIQNTLPSRFPLNIWRFNSSVNMDGMGRMKCVLLFSVLETCELQLIKITSQY
jgi:hypothetical protein